MATLETLGVAWAIAFQANAGAHAAWQLEPADEAVLPGAPADPDEPTPAPVSVEVVESAPAASVRDPFVESEVPGEPIDVLPSETAPQLGPPASTPTSTPPRPAAAPACPACQDRRSSRPPRFGGYGGFDKRLGTASRKLGVFLGFRGGVILFDRVSIGGAAYWLQARLGKPIRDSLGNEMRLDVSYAGLTVGVTALRRKRVQLGVRGLFGGGSACIGYAELAEGEDPCYERVRIRVIEPSAVLYVKLFPFLRLAVEGGYRVVARESWRPPNNFPLSGGFGGLAAEFGWFGR